MRINGQAPEERGHDIEDELNDPALSLEERDERESAAHWAAAIELKNRKELFTAVCGYKADRVFALECAIAAHGFLDVLGVKDMTELARRWNCTKYNVTKLVGIIQRKANLPPASFQRDADSRRAMKESRNGQLKGRNNGNNTDNLRG